MGTLVSMDGLNDNSFFNFTDFSHTKDEHISSVSTNASVSFTTNTYPYVEDSSIVSTTFSPSVTSQTKLVTF